MAQPNLDYMGRITYLLLYALSEAQKVNPRQGEVENIQIPSLRVRKFLFAAWASIKPYEFVFLLKARKLIDIKNVRFITIVKRISSANSVG